MDFGLSNRAMRSRSDVGLRNEGGDRVVNRRTRAAYPKLRYRSRSSDGYRSQRSDEVLRLYCVAMTRARQTLTLLRMSSGHELELRDDPWPPAQRRGGDYWSRDMPALVQREHRQDGTPTQQDRALRESWEVVVPELIYDSRGRGH